MKKLLWIGILAAGSMLAQSSDGDSGTDGSSDGSAVPEPATIGLMAVGLAGVGYSAWRQKRKK